MEAGLVRPVTEGTPQGGPLSPLLSNLLLDDFDKELEKRGLKFARYADDCNVYVKSERQATRGDGGADALAEPQTEAEGQRGQERGSGIRRRVSS